MAQNIKLTMVRQICHCFKVMFCIGYAITVKYLFNGLSSTFRCPINEQKLIFVLHHMDRTNQIIITLCGESGIVVFFQTAVDLNTVAVSLLQPLDLRLILGNFFLAHGELGINIHKGVTGKSNGIKSFFNSGQHHFFQSILTITQNAVGM